MSTEPVKFTIRLEGSDDMSDSEKYEMALRLQDELLEGEADSVEPLRSSESPPEGAKGEPITIATILIAAAAATIPNIILFIQNWLLRQKDQKIKVKIGGTEIEVPRDATREEISRIVKIVKNIPDK